MKLFEKGFHNHPRIYIQREETRQKFKENDTVSYKIEYIILYTTIIFTGYYLIKMQLKKYSTQFAPAEIIIPRLL